MRWDWLNVQKVNSFHSDQDRFEHSFKKNGCARDHVYAYTE